MSRTMFAGVLTLVLLPGNALAGPPEGVSGRMVLDEVADGLRKYRAQKDPVKRAWLLVKLAPLNDPRVAMALGEALDDPDDWFAGFAASLTLQYYCDETLCYGGIIPAAKSWWSRTAPYLRRRAKELPR